MKKTRRRWLRRMLAALGAAALLLAGAALSLNQWANSTRLPPELLKAPIALPSSARTTPSAGENETEPGAGPTTGTAERADGAMPASPDAMTSAPGRPAPPSTTEPPLDELVKFSGSYATYLDLCARHDPAWRAAATLYRELGNQLKDEKIDVELRFGLFGNPDPYRQARWRPGSGPLNPAQAEWLRAHAGLVDRALRLAEAVPLPAPSLAARLACIERLGHPDPLPGANFISWQTIAKILAAEGQRRWQEGDPAGARQAELAILRLAGQFGPNSTIIDGFIRFELVGMAGAVLQDWIEDPAAGLAAAHQASADPAGLLAWRDALARSHRELFGNGRATAGFCGEYLLQRANLVADLSGSWRSPVFGYDVGDLNFPADKYALNLPVAGGVRLPRLDKVTLTSLRAMARKGQSAAILRDYDAHWRVELDRLALPYPAFHASPDPNPRGPADSLQSFYWLPEARDYQVRGRRSEARLNLARAAVEWLLTEKDPNITMPPAAGAAPLDPESPWRDPFTEQTFHVETIPATGHAGTAATLITTTTSTMATTITLIWSLGPDLQDQHGALAYDPSNGTVSPGDLAIRVPRESAERSDKP